MAESNSNKQKKTATLHVDDVYALIHRYSPDKILTLLKEISQCDFTDSEKIDWDALVKRTSTGITNPREYQMLWRHLAYRDELEKLDDGAQPLDDDSDLECELEVFPTASGETLTEVAACVKEIIALPLPSDPRVQSNSIVEAPSNIMAPNGQLSGSCFENSKTSCSARGTKLAAPMAAQQQCVPTFTTTEALDANGAAGSSVPPRKRRKKWTADEDTRLIAAVQKHGEGNWTTISRVDFNGERTAHQLSLRYGALRKRNSNLIVRESNSSGQQLSQAQLEDTRHSLSVALNMPVGNLTTACSVSTAGSKSVSRNSMPLTASRPASKKPPIRPTITSNSLLQATAVAVGARIATSEDAASLLKAAHAKNAVHIMPGGASLMNSSMPISRVTSTIPKKIENIQENRACLSGNAASQQVHEDQGSSPFPEPADENQMTIGNEPKEHLEENQASTSGRSQSQQVQAEKASPVSVTPVKVQLAVENPKSLEPSGIAEVDPAVTVGNQAAIGQNTNVKVGGEDQSIEDVNVKEGGDYHSTTECKVA